MHTRFLAALEGSLRGIAPADGIAYLLCQVIPHYWIPVAASCKTLEEIPYYRLGYAFELNACLDRKPRQVSDELSELVLRGKIEALVFEKTFYQEVIPVEVDGSAPLVIIRSSTKPFDQLSPDASGGVNPLIHLVHETWGDFAFTSLKDDNGDGGAVTPASIAHKVAEQLSDKHSFPPYFLLTDYVLAVHASEGSQERNICSNPLGYTCWIRRFLAETPPPWVHVMATRTESYADDLRNPQGVTPEQARSYAKQLEAYDVLATHLADTLRDDVRLVAYVPEGSVESARIRLWARHNRPKASSVITFPSVKGCESAAKALSALLRETREEDDFLITLWATQMDSQKSDWKPIHVGCDTAHRISSCPENIHDAQWPSAVHPENSDTNTFPRIEVRFRPFDKDLVAKTEAAVQRVLKHSAEQFSRLNHEAAIRSFWNKVTCSKEKYLSHIFKTGEERHETWWWKKTALETQIKDELATQVISDMAGIAHFTSWSGIKAYVPEFKQHYVHLARGFRDLNISAELLEFILGCEKPSQREHLEYINCGSQNAPNLLVALWLLRSDGWKLNGAKLRTSLEATSGRAPERFTLELELETSPEKLAEVAASCFQDQSAEDCGKKGELRSACTWLRQCAAVFSVFVVTGKNNRLGIYCEFNGGKKVSEKKAAFVVGG